MGQNGLKEFLKNSTSIRGVKQAITGGRGAFGSTENMIVKIKNDGIWIDLHKSVLKLLDKKIESRDPHFEGENYLPHITWRLKGLVKLDPEVLENKTYQINHLYLIERIHPNKSIAKIIAKIPL